MPPDELLESDMSDMYNDIYILTPSTSDTRGVKTCRA